MDLLKIYTFLDRAKNTPNAPFTVKTEDRSYVGVILKGWVSQAIIGLPITGCLFVIDGQKEHAIHFDRILSLENQ